MQPEIAAQIAANPDDAWTTGELCGLIFNRSEPAFQWRAPVVSVQYLFRVIKSRRRERPIVASWRLI
jgi:hypothetical protein